MKKEKKPLPILLQLYLVFLKIGLFTFGGGYAMIAIIESECIEKRKWLTAEDMINVTAVAESTPGPIAINCATFTGYRQGGFWGALLATLGNITPSFIIIYIISQFLDNLLEYRVVENAFTGIKVAVGILIIRAAIKLFKKIKKDAFGIILFVLSVSVTLATNIFSWNFSSVYLVLIAGIAGLTAHLIRSLYQSKHKEGSK